MGGSPSTHVANAYDKPVYVKAEAERCDLPLASYSVSLGVEVSGVGEVSYNRVDPKAQWDWHKIISGYTRINPGDFVRFDVNLPRRKDTVYISAIISDGILVANSMPKMKDLSVIVGANAQIFDTEYGFLWRDTHGHYHLNQLSHGGLRVGRSKRAVQRKPVPSMQGTDQKAIQVPLPPQMRHNATKYIGNNAMVMPVAAAVGVCLVIFLALLVVIGIKMLRGRSKVHRSRRRLRLVVERRYTTCKRRYP